MLVGLPSLLLTFSTTTTAKVSAPRAGRTVPPHPQEIPWYSFLLQAEWAPGILNEDRRIRLLENVQGPYKESNSEPPVMRRGASINCATARHTLK